MIGNDSLKFYRIHIVFKLLRFGFRKLSPQLNILLCMRSIIKFMFLIFSTPFFGQKSIDKLLDKHNVRSIPYISVQELKMEPDTHLLLDVRKKEEFLVSHIPNAIWIGEQLDKKEFITQYPDKAQKIVVYCTVGIRSEHYGEKLKNLGYTQVKNLYGSIFAWKDAGYPVIDQKGKETQNVHVFSKTWAKYLKTGSKIY